GFARTRRHARQLVNHGHYLVNGQEVDIPSFQVSAYDIIDVREKSLEMTPFIVARETFGERIVPAWLESLPNRMRILVHQVPVRAQIDMPIQEQLIVEFYSKK
ncbi:MAG: S4 domain-containing protein, partial [Nocardioides sp.]|nr:S4 domain-containing protein [Nocardioides sp.]